MTTDPKTPKVLYKYMTMETARTVLSTGRLRFRSPLSFNDPFDFQWNPLWFTTQQRFKRQVKRDLKALVADRSSWPKDDREVVEILKMLEKYSRGNAFNKGNELFNAYVSGLEASTQSGMTSHTIMDTRRRCHVCCFSEHPDSILMWSHYADQHRGVALGFDVRKLMKWSPNKLKKVVYSTRLPIVFDRTTLPRDMISGKTRNIDNLEVLILAKANIWSYEDEWRCIHKNKGNALGDCTDIRFPREALSEVILGCKSDSVRGVELEALSLPFNDQVITRRLAPHPTKFGLIDKEDWR